MDRFLASGADEEATRRIVSGLNHQQQHQQLAAGPTTDEPFTTEAVYELKIDTDGDAIDKSRSGERSKS